jgi:hypothetical protein
LQWLEKALLRHLLFADSLRKQAMSQACAVCSPVSWGFERNRDISTPIDATVGLEPIGISELWSRDRQRGRVDAFA